MKSYRYLAIAMLSTLMLIGMQSCFQDMDNEPAYNYPDADDTLEGAYGESFYLPFEDNFKDQIYSFEADVIGKPTFAEGKIGKAYKGAQDSYISFVGGAVLFKKNFTIAFWYKLDPNPNKAGIISLSPPRKDNADVKSSGLRIFRENTNDLKVLFGDGAKDYSITSKVTANEWVYITVTLSGSKCILYIDGEKKASLENNFKGISWKDVNTMSIGSGEPLFITWSHFSDLSLIDELRIFNKELSQEEIKSLVAIK